LFRNTGPLSEQEVESLHYHQARTGQKFILTYRTYSDWDITPDSGAFGQAVELYAGQAASLANGFGFYSFNEMVDVHLAYSPVVQVPQWKREQAEKAINLMGAMVKRYRQLAEKR